MRTEQVMTLTAALKDYIAHEALPPIIEDYAEELVLFIITRLDKP